MEESTTGKAIELIRKEFTMDERKKIYDKFINEEYDKENGFGSSMTGDYKMGFLDGFWWFKNMVINYLNSEEGVQK